ncbi:MAG: DEAD/DEAH box helicase, partial [Myxococcota bacterium]
VAMCADEERSVESLFRTVRRAYPYEELPRDGFLAVLDMLAGRYPSNEMADLRPRLAWDRERDVLRARKGARMVTLLNAGTIPDRGLFRVQLGPGGPKLGELDEEMVYESKVGDTFALGASTWKIEEITHDRVVVSPAPGEMGRLPFWRGDGVGRPKELGVRQGALLRELAQRERDDAKQWLSANAPVDELAAGNLADFVHEQLEHAGAVPHDELLLAERFRDELGDWRVCLLSPFGGRVHAPLAIAAQAKLSARTGVEVEVTYNDDGLVWRCADLDELPAMSELLPRSDEVERLVTEHVRRSAMFASMFRENAGRSLLLTRRSVDGRNPLWSQRLKAKNLLAVVQRFPRFPIVLETYRQCLQDIFDVRGLVELLESVENGEIRLESKETRGPSPFATSVVFEHQANYLYEMDAPAAETRARALTLDRSLLRELLGSESERTLVDSEVLEKIHRRLQRTDPERQARDPDELHDVLRELGALTLEELEARSNGLASGWLGDLCKQGRAVSVGGGRWAAAENALVYEHALDWPVGDGALALDENQISDPIGFVIERYAARNVPFDAATVSEYFRVPATLLVPVLERLVAEGRLISGELHPDGTATEWCDPEVWRRLKRVTLSRLRESIKPASSSDWVRYLLDHQGLTAPRRGIEGLERVLEQLEGVSLPWSVWQGAVLPMRVADFRPDMLDTLCAGGSWVWLGAGSLGKRDGRVAFFRAHRAPMLVGERSREEPKGLSAAVLEAMPERGALFSSELSDIAPAKDVEKALLELAWDGWVRNDTIGPLLRAGQRAGSRRRRGLVRGVDGRWSRVRLTATDTPTETALERARLLLGRYGVVTAQAAATESLPGGFSAIYDVLREMEEQGQIRRGNFVDGEHGAQFASSSVVDALRGRGSGESVIALAATDPAQPHGALLPWPEHEGQVRRAAGAFVLFVDATATVYVSSSLRELTVFDQGERLDRALRWLREHQIAGVKRAVAIDSVNSQPVRSGEFAPRLASAGWVQDHRGFLAP